MDYATLTYLSNLSDAQSDSDGVVIFEGDMGGQIYLTAHASLVRCSEQVLRDLLVAIDEGPFGFNDADSTSMSFASCEYNPDGPVHMVGGMGGGIINGGIWIHEDLAPIADAITAVLEGREELSKRIPLFRVPRAAKE